MSRLGGRVALVTGGAQGIGAATAMRLARDGNTVGVLDVSETSTNRIVDEIVRDGGTAIALMADVANRAQVESAIARLVQQFGGLHILVNNAGVLRDNLLFKMSDQDWALVMDVHLRGAFVCSQIAQQHMVTAGSGRIVNLSSTSALGNRGQANYSTAKAGLQGFTRTLAIELGPYGVTVNAVAPGFVETPMTSATAERLGSSIEQVRAAVASSLPVRRPGMPADIAHAVSFLTSEDSGYITGQVLYVDGGQGIGV